MSGAPQNVGEAVDGLVRLRQIVGDRRLGVDGLVPVSASTWWSWVSDGRAPQPVRVGRATFWRRREVLDFVARAK